MNTSPHVNVFQFATYGSLRDDDDTRASWTQSFLDGATLDEIKFVKIPQYKMLYKKKRSENWPYALKTGDEKDYIIAKIIPFAPEKFDAKLIEADEIEQHDPTKPEESMYKREIVVGHVFDPRADATATVAAAAAVAETMVHAVMYFVETLSDDAEYHIVPGGDWLQRDREFVLE